MSATSGIPVSPGLYSAFADAVDSKSIRFIKVSIKDESLIHDLSVPATASFQDDLQSLQDESILQQDSPAYVLAKLDQPSSDWVAIFYVPDSAKVRDKMLYASTRASLFKGLGSTLFTDSIFATSKTDLTAEAYAAHLKHLAAPKPLSAREKEMADLRLAESGTDSLRGSQARINHIGTGVGFNWSIEVEEAVTELARGEGCALVVVAVDSRTETLVLEKSSEITIETLGLALPPSEPCYAILAWPHTLTGVPRRETVFIYSCPSNSPVKNRMVYSSGSTSTFRAAKALLVSSSPNITIAPRTVETSDPSELDESYLKAELNLENIGEVMVRETEDKKPFARPKGPARRR